LRERSDTLVTEKNEWLFNISLQFHFVRLQSHDIISEILLPRTRDRSAHFPGHRSSAFSLFTFHFSPLPFAFCLFTSKPVHLVAVGPHNIHNAIFPFYESSAPFTHSIQFGTAPPAAGRYLHRFGGYTCTRFSPLQSVHPAAIRTG